MGDSVSRRLCYGAEGGGDLPPARGNVIYIHPERRFFTAEFPMGRQGSIRESFPIRGRITAPVFEPGEEPRYYGARTQGDTPRSLAPAPGTYIAVGRHYETKKKAAATAGKKVTDENR